jgi:hypothetical protein
MIIEKENSNLLKPEGLKLNSTDKNNDSIFLKDGIIFYFLFIAVGLSQR